MTYNLTAREKECLYWAGRRLSDSEIAQKLGMSPKTVGNHLSRAYSKLGVRDRIRAAARLSEIYPEYPIPIGLEGDEASPAPPSAQRTDTDAGGVAGAFAKLPRPPSPWMRFMLILLTAASVAFVFAGVTVIMSVSTEQAAEYAPENAR